MASPNDNVSMALFCDFENVALGVRDANYDKFDIKPVLERLLLKGSIVVKKAYCDWDRYKGFKAPMHEANFELIEIPHVRQSGKNSADIRMVVDALDLCYTKSHVDTFVIISGDSDFSPLVSKLRENAKKVIGVGVKQSTSDLLVANCDEFIFYDDLVRESRRAAAKRDPREAQPAVKRTPEEEKRRRDDMEKRRNQAMEIVVGTFDALVSERGDSGKIWASVLKEAIKRRKPDFSESYYGFRTFGNLLEEARARGLLEFGRDEKSGAYVYRSSGAASTGMAEGAGAAEGAPAVAEAVEAPRHEGRQDGRRGRGRGRGQSGRHAERGEERATELVMDAEPELLDAEPFEVVEVVELVEVLAPADAGEIIDEADIIEAEVAEPRQEGRHGRGKRGGRKQAERKGGKPSASAAVDTVAAQSPAPADDVTPVHHADQAPDAQAAQAVELDADVVQAGDAKPAKAGKAAKPPAKGARAAKAATKKTPAAKAKAKPAAAAADVVEAAPVAEVQPVSDTPAAASHEAQAPAKPARKPQPRGRRPRKDAKSEA
ncbi:NYN domain-containing protein [Rugamonas apoptosis]|uniref:NYN domain-containing protein n=1 Tax=Rugamonas apoptosis TaxID=2758570 RepID=A0A7W2F5K1_9BURK|nr:NYN domain-containing protein [Rugamonas apoptosis]MBA5685535.1 NYN domain-containing protein [Rugamonas apoptosis]